MSAPPSEPDVAGRRSRRRPRRRRPGLRRGLLLALVVLLVAGAWVGVRGLLAQRALSSARTALADAPQALIDRRLDVATASIERAGVDTERARSLTGDPVWALAGYLPFVGDSLQTARGVAVAADEVARDVLPTALSGVRQVDPEALRRDDGTVDVALLQKATPPVVDSARSATRVRTALAGLPVDGAVGQVRSGHTELTTNLDRLERVLGGASEALQVAPALLGQDKPRRFFVMVQQSAESRGTGGIIGGFAVIEAAAGRISLVDSGSNADLEQGPVPPAEGTPEDYRRRYSRLGSFTTWQQVNYSPDLPVVARNVAARWAAQSGAPVDGVVALDPRALALIFAGGEPIPAGDGRSVPPEQLEQFLAVGQYEGVPVTQEGVLERKDQLSDIAGAAVTRLTAGAGDPTALLRGLTDAVQSGHLRMASDDPALQPTLARTGVQGGMPVGDAPTAYLVLNNAAANKLDQYLDRSLEYELGPCQGDRRPATVRVRLRSAPPADLPPYTTYRDDAATKQSRSNRIRVSVYGTVGADIERMTLDGEVVDPRAFGSGVRLDLGEEAGRPVWSVVVELPPEQEREVVLTLDEPAVVGQPQLPHQPLPRPLLTRPTPNSCG